MWSGDPRSQIATPGSVFPLATMQVVDTLSLEVADVLALKDTSMSIFTAHYTPFEGQIIELHLSPFRPSAHFLVDVDQWCDLPQCTSSYLTGLEITPHIEDPLSKFKWTMSCNELYDVSDEKRYRYSVYIDEVKKQHLPMEVSSFVFWGRAQLTSCVLSFVALRLYRSVAATHSTYSVQEFDFSGLPARFLSSPPRPTTSSGFRHLL